MRCHGYERSLPPDAAAPLVPQLPDGPPWYRRQPPRRPPTCRSDPHPGPARRRRVGQDNVASGAIRSSVLKSFLMKF